MRILGHDFKKMEGTDFDGFAGAGADAWICELDETEDGAALILIWEPSTGELHAMDAEGSDVVWKAVRA
jgi:hypothetical protein